MSCAYNVYEKDGTLVCDRVDENTAREHVSGQRDELRVETADSGRVPEWSLTAHQQAERFAREAVEPKTEAIAV